MTARVGRRALSYEEFMSACEAMVALHGALAQQQIKRLPSEYDRTVRPPTAAAAAAGCSSWGETSRCLQPQR
jgi:hypothetical protein